MKMQKRLIALLMSSVIITGCSSMGGDEPITPTVLKSEYSAIAKEKFQHSQIDQLSPLATTTNELFLESYPIYQDYVYHVENSNGVGASHSAAVAMLDTDDDRKDYLVDLKNHNKQEYKQYEDFINNEQIKSIYARVGKAALKAITQSALISKIDTSSLITNSGLGFMELGKEKDVVTLMSNQISLMNKTTVALHNEYKANKAANQIK